MHVLSQHACTTQRGNTVQAVENSISAEADLCAGRDEQSAQHRGPVPLECLQTGAVGQRPQPDSGIPGACQHTLLNRAELHAPHPPPMPP